jgi:hypothetical protein
MKEPNWLMSPMERITLFAWLSRFKAEEIMVDAALDQLKPFGITYDPVRGRLVWGNRSVELPLHARDYFARILSAGEGGGRGRGFLTKGMWVGVFMLDVAVALLNLAGIEHDPTLALPTKSARYDVICTLFRDAGEVMDANDIAGEVRE